MKILESFVESTITLEEAQHLLHAIGLKLVIDGFWFYTNESVIAYLLQQSTVRGGLKNLLIMNTSRYAKSYVRILRGRTLPRIKNLLPMMNITRISWDVVPILEQDKQLKTAKDYQEVAA